MRVVCFADDYMVLSNERHDPFDVLSGLVEHLNEVDLSTAAFTTSGEHVTIK